MSHVTQFMIARTGNSSVAAPDGIFLLAIAAEDHFLRGIAAHYFADPSQCRSVVDAAGVLEPLIDEVWSAQQRGCGVASTAFARLARQLVAEGADFVCWHADDFLDLPVVTSWDAFLHELVKQTRAQPADFFVHYEKDPARANGTTRVDS